MARPTSSYRAARRWRADCNLMQIGVITNVHSSYPQAGVDLMRVLQATRPRSRVSGDAR